MIGGIRDGHWKLMLAKGGYPQVLEPLAKTEFYRHPTMLFDLDADRGEQHDVAAEHPDVVARLSREIQDFDASLSPAPPVRIAAAPEDHRGWEKLWWGVAEAAGVSLGVVVLVLFASYRIIRRLVRR